MRHPMEAPITHLMAAAGRKGDSHVGHLTAGDVVIPREVAMRDPSILMKLKKNMEEGGGDYRTHIVGSGYENRNPHTGAPEFNWLSGILKTVLKSAPSVAGAVIGNTLLPGVGGALGAAAGSKLSGGSNTQALLSAGGTYLGSQFLGGAPGDIAGNLTTSSIPGASSLGEGLANGSLGTAGSALGASSFGSLVGGLEGQSIAGLVGGAGAAPAADTPAPNVGGPKNADLPTSAPKAASLPSSLSGFNGLDSLQQGTGIATQGVYGGGTSGDESNYFTNLLQRQLIDDKGGYNDYGSNVNPTEESYLHNNLGLQFDPNTPSLLQAIANKQAAQPA